MLCPEWWETAPMTQIYPLVIVIGLLGVGLLLNPLYLYPSGGGEVETTYTFEEIDRNEEAVQALSDADSVLTCPGSRNCRLEEAIHERGSLEYAHRIQRDGRYAVVRIGSNWYRPVSESTGNTTVLTLRSVDAMEAVEIAAVPVSEAGPPVEEGTSTGTVTVYGSSEPAVESDAVFARSGDYYYYYYVSEQSSSPHWTGGGILEFARLVLLVAGIGLLVYAGRRLRNQAAPQ